MAYPGQDQDYRHQDPPGDVPWAQTSQQAYPHETYPPPSYPAPTYPPPSYPPPSYPSSYPELGLGTAGIVRSRTTGRGLTPAIIGMVLSLAWVPVWFVGIRTFNTVAHKVAVTAAIQDPGCRKVEIYAVQMTSDAAKMKGNLDKLAPLYTGMAAELTRDAALTKIPAASAAMKKSAADFRELSSDMSHRRKPTASLSARLTPDADAVDAACGMR